MPQAPVQRRKPRPSAPASSIHSPDGPTWETAVSAFIADCKRRNLAPATVDTYASLLTNDRTRQFCRDHGVRTSTDLTADRLKLYESELLDAGLSSRTVIGYHRVFKTFAAFCMKEGYVADEKVLQVEAPKTEQYEPEVFTEDEERRLLAAAENERDRLIVEFMLATGLRLREVENVTVDDIVESPAGAYVRVRQGKGRKDRIVPLDTAKNKLSRRLLRYAETSRRRGSPDRALFLSTRGGLYGTGSKLTARGIQLMLYRLGQKTGVHVHPHKFRHILSAYLSCRDWVSEGLCLAGFWFVGVGVAFVSSAVHDPELLLVGRLAGVERGASAVDPRGDAGADRRRPCLRGRPGGSAGHYGGEPVAAGAA